MLVFILNLDSRKYCVHICWFFTLIQDSRRYCVHQFFFYISFIVAYPLSPSNSKVIKCCQNHFQKCICSCFAFKSTNIAEILKKKLRRPLQLLEALYWSPCKGFSGNRLNRIVRRDTQPVTTLYHLPCHFVRELYHRASVRWTTGHDKQFGKFHVKIIDFFPLLNK